MSAPLWKPGDVALVDSWRGEGLLAFRCERISGEPTWCVFDGHDTRGLHDHEVIGARPVVLIDPDDLAQVHRLWLRTPNWTGTTVNQIQTALRSLITPPKPPEPQGLGAVVEDGTHDVWVRTLAAGKFGLPWRSESRQRNSGWDDIAAVRVLSEGVTE